MFVSLLYIHMPLYLQMQKVHVEENANVHVDANVNVDADVGAVANEDVNMCVRVYICICALVCVPILLWLTCVEFSDSSYEMVGRAMLPKNVLQKKSLVSSYEHVFLLFFFPHG